MRRLCCSSRASDVSHQEHRGLLYTPQYQGLSDPLVASGLIRPLAAVDPHIKVAHWIRPGFIESLGALDHLHPPRHWVPSGDLRPAWLLCMITGTVKGWAVIGCLPIILLEAGL